MHVFGAELVVVLEAEIVDEIGPAEEGAYTLVVVRVEPQGCNYGDRAVRPDYGPQHQLRIAAEVLPP